VQQEEPVKKAQCFQRYGNLLKLLMNKRERDADDKLEEMAAANENLLIGFKHYKYGAFCLQAGDIKRAEDNLLKAKDLIEPSF
jgi:hypothetical protein